MSIRPPNPNAEVLRYTTLADIKARLGIEDTDTSRDDEITAAGIGGEYALDAYLGRGFPDIPDTPATLIGTWATERPVSLIIPPLSGEVRMDAGAAMEMNKTDLFGVDFSAEVPVVGDYMRITYPVIVGQTLLQVTDVVDNGAFWSFEMTYSNGIGVPPTINNDLKFEALNDAYDPLDPSIQIVPKSVEMAALSMAIAIWKEADAPGGSAGSSDFFGAVSTADTARQIVQRNPALQGLKIGAGFGIA